MNSDNLLAPRTSISRGLIFAALLLTAAIVLRRLTPAQIGPELSSRLFGILMGAVVVIYSNAVPKALTPLLRVHGDPVAEQSFRRYVGWTLTLGGLAYAAAWAFAPIGSANALAGTLLGASVLLVVVRLAVRKSRDVRASN